MKQRIKTALVLILISVPCIFNGGVIFDLLLVITSILGIRELIKVININSKNILLNVIIYIYAMYLIFASRTNFFGSNSSIVLFAVLIFILSIFEEQLNIEKINFLLGFTTFVCIALHCIRVIRIDYGINAILYIAFATYGSDTGAYLAGVKFGKHKLIPRLSPKKTIEGSIGGIIMGTVLSTLFISFYSLEIPFVHSFVLAIILTITAQIGDLSFSSVKRYYNIKDFSHLLPGHGGVLDRIDSLLFNSLIFALYILLFV